jgi:hypothetical protein
MPVLVSERLLSLDYFWFGGGHTDVKLSTIIHLSIGMKVQEMMTMSELPILSADIVYDE